jgi:hypothetical protein
MKAKFFSQISDHQQRMAPRPLRGAFLIPPALLVVADFGRISILNNQRGTIARPQTKLKIIDLANLIPPYAERQPDRLQGGDLPPFVAMFFKITQ